MDREYWIWQRASELADIQYVISFDKLTEETRERLLAEAEEDYINRQIAKAEAV